jgi:ATP-dependent Lhr-like helicase
MSGIQFVRENDYPGSMAALEQPREETLWLNAVDPSQPWGKSIKHKEGRSFLNVTGTAVALYAGIPAAVLERQGRCLRVFEQERLKEVLGVFAEDYARRRIFASQNRIVVKEYPEEAAGSLRSAGFIHELQDYVLYR